MLCWVLVEQARHEHMSDEYKKRYIVVIVPRGPILGTEYTRPPMRTPQVVHNRTDRRGKVKRTNTDLPNTYRRSTTESIMHAIGQNILLIYPYFGIDFLQPHRFLNSKDSEAGTSFRLPAGKCISSLLGRYPYRNS